MRRRLDGIESIQSPALSSISSALPWVWTTKHHTSTSHTRQGDFDKSWYQGRGVFGGILASLILDTMIAIEPNRTPRTFTLHCCAPALIGAGEVRADIERRGKRVTHLTGRLTGVNGVIAFATATFAAPRHVDLTLPAESAPEVPSPEGVSELPLDTPMMPDFCRHFSYRFCIGGHHFQGLKTPVMGGWCDFRSPYEVSAPMVATLLDAWAPACFVSLKAPTPAASVDFSYHFLTSEWSTLERPFLYRGEVHSLADGYAEERDHLWDAKGRPVAVARQLIALGT
jgi:acyl-CoA thioesterase